MKFEWVWVAGATLLWAAVFLGMQPISVALYAWLSMAAGILILCSVVFFGRTLRYSRANALLSVYGLEKHRVSISLLTATMCIGVVGVEIAIRKVGGLWGNPTFVAFHIMLAMSMLVTFLLARFWYTGTKNPVYHRRLVYFFCILYISAFTTGTALLHEKFPMLFPSTTIHTNGSGDSS